ncbi:hypothetical protein BOO71_0005452 [Deinococcus marmoris]|uniref:Uncharacterized protein n=1 Tax=Deinococcus marmoris TaxID=249408 RepID=A0A1U7NZU0_9DEIO|nr:hypothetical protein BOO71_0005452 [Deinococcus marmoris]
MLWNRWSAAALLALAHARVPERLVAASQTDRRLAGDSGDPVGAAGPAWCPEVKQ